MEEAGFDLPTWGSAKWCYISGSYIQEANGDGPGEGETNRKQNTTFSLIFWILGNTLPQTNLAPETLGVEDEFPFGKASCQVYPGVTIVFGGVY